MTFRSPFFAASSLVITTAVMIACSSKSSTSAAPNDAGPANDDAGQDAGNPCGVADEHEGDDGGCISQIAWAAGPTLPTPRNHQMAWLVDKGPGAVFLYVAGGSDAAEKALADVERAPINLDGTLGAWVAQTPLPIATIAASVMMIDNEVVLAGGYGLANTWVSAIGADGSMGTWTAAPALPDQYFHATGVTFSNYVYVVGGLVGSTEETEVVRSTVASDGTLGAWSQVATLPAGLSHHASVVNNGILYVLGGESTDGNPIADVISTTIAADGSLSPWKTEVSLPYAVETESAFMHDGSLYIVGGIVGTNELNEASTADVTRSFVGSDGTLGPWTDDKSSALPKARSHVHQTPLYQNWVYSVAGAPTGFPSTTGAAYVGTFH